VIAVSRVRVTGAENDDWWNTGPDFLQSPDINLLVQKLEHGRSSLLVRPMTVEDHHGILSKSSVEYAFKTYARSWRREEPEPIGPGEGFAAFEKPQRFERLVWRALGEEMISPVRAAQMLGLPLSSVERDIRGPRDQ
jgi:hypothetical protein